MARSTISSRLFAGSITRPLRIIVALICGLGSARASRAQLRALAKVPSVRWLNFLFGEAPKSAREGVCAPQNKIARSLARNSSAEIKNGHADGEAVGDLVKNDALCAVSDVAVDLDAAIDRPRMHDQAIRLQQFRPLFR